jgi:glycosyltransferase involved in cell wall biosynthesis
MITYVCADARKPADAAVQYGVSIVIPAHNEERSVGRLLNGLLGADRGELEIIVVCNGCTDRTADVARSFGVRVIELAEPSKRAAVAVGNRAARRFPRLYVDADVELDSYAVRALCSAVGQPAVLAAAPQRSLNLDGASRLVRSYYAVWTRLPQVSSGLFGRGVLAVSAEGYDRISALPPAMSDDLAVSEAFGPTERTLVQDAVTVIRGPRTLRDLIRRRIRVATGNAELDLAGRRSDAAKTSWMILARMIRQEPAMAGPAVVFAAVALIAKVGAARRVRAGDFTTWLRDESSRH